MVTCNYCHHEIPEWEAVAIQTSEGIRWVCLICEDENYESIHETDERGE